MSDGPTIGGTQATSSTALLSEQARYHALAIANSDGQLPTRTPVWSRVGTLLLALSLFVTVVVLVGFHRYNILIEQEIGRAARGLDPLNIDTASKPQVDFNLYANGNWMRAHTIPDEYSRWGTFTQLQDETLIKVHQLMEYTAQFQFDTENMTIPMKVGAFWLSAHNIMLIERADVEPIHNIRKAIQQVTNSKTYSELLGQLHAAGLGHLFEISPQAHPRDSRQMILWIDQGGLGMPDREYYFDEKHSEIKFKYQQYIHNVLLLLDYSEDAAIEGSETVLRVETALAQVSQKQEARRDPTTQEHLYTLSGLKSLTGSAFHWDAYAQALQVDLKSGTINVPNPKFLQAIGSWLRNSTFLEDLKVYHDFHVISSLATSLPSRYVDALFEYHQALTGQKALSPRWKRMIKIADATIGEMVGQLYCEVFFPPESKAQALEIITNVKSSLRQMLSTLSWMGEKTRRQALKKLDKMEVKIGYPDKWIDYSSLTVDPYAPFVLNVLAAKAFNTRRLLNQLWKPVDRTLWYMTPQTVNAYYNPTANEIAFPAAFLQPPIFSPQYDLAVNYGAMGAVVGHELTHSFDDMGRRYDADGNLRDWWKPADARNFMARAALIVKQFSAYTVYGRPINGELTQGENIADLGGLKAAYHAMHQVLESNYTIDGLTQDQRFFLSWAQVWRQLAREAATLQQVATEPHPPSEWRIKGPLSNMPEFYEAFDVRPGQPMWRRPEDRVEIW